MLIRPSAMAIGFSIEVGDRPYYTYGPSYWDSGYEWVWIPGSWGNTITGCMGIMSAVASGIANMPESITTTMTTMVMNTTTTAITRISP
jgi:hypothetical protein